MCGTESRISPSEEYAAQQRWSQQEAVGSPEVLLAEILGVHLNADIDPLALRALIRSRWNRVAALAHKIHDA